MLGINWRQTVKKTILTSVIAVVLMTSLGGCGDRLPELPKVGKEKKAITVQVPQISEVSPPTAIQKLGRVLDRYQPQVSILSPKPEEVLEDNIINVQLQVKDLPIFKSDLGLGPHLEVILDNQPYKKIYNLDQPLTIKDLEPGTHTLRVFANRPWDESFKNEGAYAQSTFHVFTKTPNNNPESGQPLLTYNSPRGFYGSEPILLDFYLTNAPLHFVAEENPEDEIVDWRVRVTVNGTSFSSDRWQPMYLKGFKPGKNWIQLEFRDELGNPINNVYNNTARLITYEPGDPDTLSKLVRGEIPLTELLAIVDPTYEPETVEPETLPATPPPDEREESSSVTSSLEEVGDRYLRGQEELSPALIPTLLEKEAPETPTIEEEETSAGELLIEEIVEEEPATVDLRAPEVEIPAAVPTIEEEETSAGEPSRFKGFGIGTSTQQELNNTETTDDETLLNSLLRRFKGFGIGTSTQEPAFVQTESSTEEPENLAEEKFNFGKLLDGWRNRFLGGSETVPPTVVPTLPEIVEEGPVPEPAEELSPQESPNLIPEKDVITEEIESEPIEELVVPENIVSPRENQPESKEITVEVTEGTSKLTEAEISPEIREVLEVVSGEKEGIKEAIESLKSENVESIEKTEIIKIIPDTKDENSVYLEKKTTEKIVVTEQNDEDSKAKPELLKDSQLESEAKK